MVAAVDGVMLFCSLCGGQYTRMLVMEDVEAVPAVTAAGEVDHWYIPESRVLRFEHREHVCGEPALAG